ncbi:MAG: hypothetical protein RR536_06995 [Anaerovoracaceae bacterium]
MTVNEIRSILENLVEVDIMVPACLIENNIKYIIKNY